MVTCRTGHESGALSRHASSLYEDAFKCETKERTTQSWSERLVVSEISRESRTRFLSPVECESWSCTQCGVTG